MALEPQWCIPRTSQPSGASFWMYFTLCQAVPTDGDVVGGQQDAGDDLQDEHEQQQTAERGRPA